MNDKVIDFLKGKGKTVIKYESEDIDSKLEVWKQWYRGKVDRFHTYKIYNGKKQIKRDRKTLNMPARVCQDWADLLLNEKVEINVNNDYTQTVLNRLLNQVNFYTRGNNLIETAFALGGGFFIQYWDGQKVNQKYVTQEFMYPLTYDSGRLIEAAFSSKKTIQGKEYTYLECHTVDDNGFYVIDNYLLRGDKKALKEVDKEFYDENGIAPKVITGSTSPCFQMVRPNIANKDVFYSPFGTSIFSGETDVFKSCDVVYDSYFNEILMGKKRIFVKDGAATFNFDSDGNAVQCFDPNDTCFYAIPETANPDAPPIIESNMQLRIDELDKALQTQLNCISQGCGFGQNGYKWDSGNVTTATQVMSENSKMFRTMKKHENLLRPALVDMARGLLYFEKTYAKDNQINLDADITIDFDDSIIEDTEAVKRQAMLELNAGLIDNIEYYQIVYHMTEDQATEYDRKIKERKPQVVEEPFGA